MEQAPITAELYHLYYIDDNGDYEYDEEDNETWVERIEYDLMDRYETHEEAVAAYLNEEDSGKYIISKGPYIG